MHEFCQTTPAADAVLRGAFDRMGLSARTYDRLLKVARTIADLDGNDITHLPSAKRSMGIVFQNYALFENMTVLDNVVYAAYLKAKREKSATKAEIRAKAEDMLEILGAERYAKIAA